MPTDGIIAKIGGGTRTRHGHGARVGARRRHGEGARHRRQPELQQPIQDTFQHIIARNETLYKIRELQESGAQAESAYPYYESLAEYEAYLINNIPSIMRELEKEYGIPSVDKLRRLDSPSTA